MDVNEKLAKAEAILKQVRELRRNQKLYFDGKKYLLQKCKDLEKDIDAALINYEQQQTKLI